MTQEIIIPFGGLNPHRLRALDRVFNHLEAGGFRPILFGDSGHPHSRARCCNRGAKQATGDILVFNDADLLCPHDQIRAAVSLAEAGPGLVFAFRDYHRLDQNDEVVLAVREPPSNGCIAIQRSCFDQVGGYDEAYEGWALEDRDFNDRCAALWPHRRVDGKILHLWHGDRRPDDVPLDCDHDLAQQNRARYKSGKR